MGSAAHFGAKRAAREGPVEFAPQAGGGRGCPLRGESLDALSRELRVTAAGLSQWREVLAASQAALKPADRWARRGDRLP